MSNGFLHNRAELLHMSAIKFSKKTKAIRQLDNVSCPRLKTSEAPLAGKRTTRARTHSLLPLPTSSNHLQMELKKETYILTSCECWCAGETYCVSIWSSTRCTQKSSSDRAISLWTYISAAEWKWKKICYALLSEEAAGSQVHRLSRWKKERKKPKPTKHWTL